MVVHKLVSVRSCCRNEKIREGYRILNQKLKTTGEGNSLLFMSVASDRFAL